MIGRVLFVVGTRPEATKGWLFARELARSDRVDPVLFFTGQHTDLLEDSVRDLGVIPNISVERAVDGPHHEWKASFTDHFETGVRDCRPSAVCALGDTDSVRMAAELAAQAALPFVHLEAGIRHHGAYERAEPEELNRRRITELATLHLAPTDEAVANLRSEGVAAGRIRKIGDLSACAITCAFEGMLHRILADEASMIERTSGPYVLCTFHRSTSLWAQEDLLRHFIDTALLFKDLMFVLVGRPDSRWMEFYRQVTSVRNIYVTPAMSPSLFLSHLLLCEFVLTDSAGVQQEAIILGKDVVACRREIELYATDAKLHLAPPPFVLLPDAVSRLWPAEHPAFLGQSEPRLSEVRAEGRRIAREMARSVEDMLLETS